MTPQTYLQSKLDDLRQPLDLAKPANDEQLAEAIFKALMSKKFRKYSGTEDLVAHVKEAIRINMANNEPINITFVHGAYKLWRLEEAPEADWAELFALMYYSNWVKPICEMYEPGVWFDMYVDDLIVPSLNNVEPEVVTSYLASYQRVMDFLKPYQPANLKMTITTVGSQFESREAFDTAVQQNVKKLEATLPGGLPELTPAQKASVELNVKVTDEQLKDPQWREKVELLHTAYYGAKGEAGYHRRPNKIVAFTQQLPTTIAVGTTKDTIMKFWVGTGVLKPKDDSFRQIILSVNQLKEVQFTKQQLFFDGLEGKNFHEIRVLL